MKLAARLRAALAGPPLPAGWPLWLCPFRPFFLFTALYAVLAMAWWLGLLAGLLALPELPGGPVVWHAHEMIFGVAAASVAGFLLTAVPEFTANRPVGPRTLHWLAILWLGGRLAYPLAGALGPLPAAACDLAFLALLLAAVAGPLWRQPGRRHLAFLHSLAALTVVHAGFYWTLWRDGDALAWLRLAGGLLMMLIVIALSRISLRLVNDALEAVGDGAEPYLARPPRRNLATFAIALFSLGEFLLPGNAVTGWLALAAAAAVLNLLNDWHVGRALLRRWALIPYLVYWAMALGYATLGIGLLAGLGLDSAGRHLLLAGSLGLAILIVMAVAGRTHSGHGLDWRGWLPLAGLALLLAGLLRAAAGWPQLAGHYTTLLALAGGAWLAGWLSYLAYSWRVLAGPRPDRRGGCAEPEAAAARR